MLSTAQPRRRHDVCAAPLPDGSMVLFDPRNDMVYPVTASAARIWEACDGTHTAAAIVEDLSAVYDAPPDVLARDVKALLQHLSEVGLLEPITGARA